MTRITNTDQVLLLLREQLTRLGKEPAGRRAAASRTRETTPEPLDRVRALAARDGISEDDLKRALVRGLLVGQLGEALAADPRFEAMSTEVIRIIGESDAGRDLLDRALQQLGAP
jgi:hypothetical protein